MSCRVVSPHLLGPIEWLGFIIIWHAAQETCLPQPIVFCSKNDFKNEMAIQRVG